MINKIKQSTMSEEKIFKTHFTLKFSNPQIEEEYSNGVKKTIKKYIKIITIIIAILSVASSVQISFFFKFAGSINFYKILFMSHILTFIYLILTILVFRCINKTKLIHWIMCLNLYFLTFVCINVRFPLTRFSLVDPIFFYVFLCAEIVFRLVWANLGLNSFIETLIINILSIISIYSFYPSSRIAEERNISYIIITAIGFTLIVAIILTYFLELSWRKTFYYNYQDKIKSAWFSNILENMKTGYMSIQNENITYINSYLKEKFNKYSYLKFQNLDNNQETDEKTLNLVEEIKEEIEKLQAVASTGSFCHGQSFSKEDKFIPILVEKLNKLSSELNAFTYVGEKTLVVPQSTINSEEGEYQENYEIVFEIFLKFVSSDKNKWEIDLLFNDVTRSKLNERTKTEIKYKSTILSKIAHEFKNPVICINELSTQLKQELDIKENEGDFNLDAEEENKSQEENANYNSPEIRIKNPNKKCSNVIKILNNIQSFANYLLILVKDINYFSLMSDQNTINIEIRKTNLHEIIEFTKNIVETLIKKFNKEKAVKFKVKIDKGIPKEIMTDEWRIKQILINLISNSIKFTLTGEIVLEFLLEQNFIKIVIKDTGIGIREEQQKKLFKPFEMGSVGNINNDLGSGLGLSIVKELTKKLGEEIKFESKENVGSTFWFRIPFQNNILINSEECGDILLLPAIQSDNNESIMTKEKNLSFDLNNYPIEIEENGDIKIIKKEENLIWSVQDILKYVNLHNQDENSNNLKHFIVVDDEELTRRSTIRLLQESLRTSNTPFRIIEAEDGAECIYIVYKLISMGLKIGLILSDQTMNYILGTTSADIIQDIRRSKNIPPFPFILLTAFTNFEHNKSITNFISKPLTKQKLAQCIGENFENS